MAFHLKTNDLMSLNPDIAIIPESATPDIIKRKNPNFMFEDADWFGHNKNKGLGVYTFNGFRLTRHSSFDSNYELFLPLVVSGKYNLNLVAVWAFNHRSKKSNLNHPAPTRAAIEYYSDFIKKRPSIVAGDYNHNVIWDKPGHKSNFSCIIDELNSHGLVSAYHAYTKDDFGKELAPTTMWRRNRSQPYHIDYCFISEKLINKVERVNVGKAELWLSKSDHMPIVVKIRTS